MELSAALNSLGLILQTAGAGIAVRGLYVTWTEFAPNGVGFYDPVRSIVGVGATAPTGRRSFGSSLGARALERSVLVSLAAYSAESVHPVRGFRPPVVGGRGAADVRAWFSP